MNSVWLKSGIYSIQSVKQPDKIYIGSAVNLYQRRNRHFNDLKFNRHFNLKLQRFYNKYGNHSLQFNILLLCPINDLLPWEQFFIDKFNPYFNILPTAGSRAGSKHSIETKNKIKRSWQYRSPIPIISRLFGRQFLVE